MGTLWHKNDNTHTLTEGGTHTDTHTTQTLHSEERRGTKTVLATDISNHGVRGVQGVTLAYVSERITCSLPSPTEASKKVLP